MDLEAARELIRAHLKEQFGRVVQLRDVSVARSSSGRVWLGEVYCVTKSGDIEVGKVGVTEGGRITGGLGVDELIEALFNVGRVEEAGRAGETESAAFSLVEDDFSDLVLDDSPGGSDQDGQAGSDLDDFFSDLDSSGIKGKIISLLTSGNREDLLEARRLLPQLLASHEERGVVLRQMGELELRLGEVGLGLDYLEAAAREFADRADVEALEHLVELTSGVIPAEELQKHATRVLLDQTRHRLRPLESLADVPAFAGLTGEELSQVSEIAEHAVIEEGQAILEEGAQAVTAFVIKSGILAVRLQCDEGGSRLVRCCFPGELVGESSVLDMPGATCNATVSTKTTAELWRFEGALLRKLLGKMPDLRARMEAKRTLHRLDSFFSMHRATDTLDARVRDRLLGCITAILHARPGKVLESKGKLPSAVYLLLDGRIEYVRPGLPPRVYEVDSFSCLHDTLHELPLEGDLVAVEPSRLIAFDTDALRALAREAPPDVVAVLERLE